MKSIIMELYLAMIVSVILKSANVAAQSSADAVYLNGKIWTGLNPAKEVSAMAISGDRITAIGDDANIKSLAGKGTKIIDLQGKRVLPGFNDAHLHFTAGGFSLLGIDLRHARDEQEFRRILQEYAAKLAPGRWITGGDWDHEVWPNQKWPTRQLIDDVTSQNPVLVSRLDGHIALANSLALKLAGVDKETPDPFGGMIVRDPKSGEPTGILKDNAADLIYRIIPNPTHDEIWEAARVAQEHALSLGVTSMQCMSVSQEEYEICRELYETRALKARLYLFRAISGASSLGEIDKSDQENPWLRMGGIKLFADGSMGGGSALFYEPYEDDPSTFGLAIMPKEELELLVQKADSLGLQIALHAIGDKANTWALDAYEHALQSGGRRALRHRIEHAQVVNEKDLPRFAKLGVVASVQPSHCIDDMRWAEKRIGSRTRQAYLWRSFSVNHARMAFGTDWPVEPLNPMLGLYAAITREFAEGGPKGGWHPQEKISLEEAIRCYTSGSAFAEFMENDKGILEPGKLADFVVLDKDIFTIPANEILLTKVDMTVVGGKVEYEK